MTIESIAIKAHMCFEDSGAQFRPLSHLSKIFECSYPLFWEFEDYYPLIRLKTSFLGDLKLEVTVPSLWQRLTAPRTLEFKKKLRWHQETSQGKFQ